MQVDTFKIDTDLQSGKREALEAFYQSLLRQKDNVAFWEYLNSLSHRSFLPGRRGTAELVKSHLNLENFDAFARSVPIGVLLGFLFLAMQMSGCKSDDSIVAVPNNRPQIADSGNLQETQDAVPLVAEDTAASAIDTTLNEDIPPTAEELRTTFLAYIEKAQLPIEQKRRMLRIAKGLSDDRMVNMQTSLEKVFQLDDPKKIAAKLEAMVVFRPKKPPMSVRYKGVDFS